MQMYIIPGPAPTRDVIPIEQLSFNFDQIRIASTAGGEMDLGSWAKATGLET